jgi:hypothetical protein
MTAKLYGDFLVSLSKGYHDLSTDSIKGMLCTSSYSPNQDTHDFKDDVTNEVSGDGYDAGGKALSGVSVTYNSTDNQMEMAANDLEWAASTITDARYLVLYNDSTGVSNETKRLIGYVNFEANKSSSSSTFKIEFTDGIVLKITTA